MQAQDQNNTAFRRTSQNEDDFDDLFDKPESLQGGDNLALTSQDKAIKMSQVLEGSLYIEL